MRIFPFHSETIQYKKCNVLFSNRTKFFVTIVIVAVVGVVVVDADMCWCWWLWWCWCCSYKLSYKHFVSIKLCVAFSFHNCVCDFIYFGYTTVFLSNLLGFLTIRMCMCVCISVWFFFLFAIKQHKCLFLFHITNAMG